GGVGGVRRGGPAARVWGARRTGRVTRTGGRIRRLWAAIRVGRGVHLVAPGRGPARGRSRNNPYRVLPDERRQRETGSPSGGNRDDLRAWTTAGVRPAGLTRMTARGTVGKSIARRWT